MNKLVVAILGSLSIGLVPEHADNDAAIGAGLTTGQLYRTVDTLKVVH